MGKENKQKMLFKMMINMEEIEEKEEIKFI